MTTSLEQAGSDLARAGSRKTDRAVTLAAVVAGLTTAAVVRDGAFHKVDAFAVAGASLVVVAVVLRAKTDRSARFVAASVGALAAWWLVLAFAHGAPSAFLPLGASMVAFLASFLVIRDLDLADRRTSAQALVGLGAVVSSIGLVAVALHWYPLAIHPGASWRLASTLTYQNAAGLLLVMALLVGVGLDQAQWPIRLACCLCAAGLVATQSRGAVLALLVGAAFVPVGAWRKALLPVLAGLLAGVFVVVLSADAHFQLLVVVPVICGGVVSVVLPRYDEVIGGTTDLVRAVSRLLALGFGVAVVWFLAHPVRTHLAAVSGGARFAIWRAALDQWRSSPLIGVGPDRLLHLHSSLPSANGVAILVHNEYLQLLANGGLIAAGLLVAVVVSVFRSVRCNSVLSSCAVAALVAFAVAGAFDFDWHLPALALMAGWVAGLASRRTS
jgi:O-antigen ligase